MTRTDLNILVQSALAALPGRASGSPDVLSETEMSCVVDAVLVALREPSAAMIAASNREWDGRMSHRSSGAFQAMIDVARAELGIDL